MLTDVKMFLGLTTEDKDDLLKAIINIASSRLCILINKEEVPSKLEYIVIELAIKRFNKLNNEGMDNYRQDGESISFSNNDFAEFQNDIESFLENESDSEKGKMRFL